MHETVKIFFLFSIFLSCCSSPSPVPSNLSNLDISARIQSSAAISPGDVFEVKVYRENDLCGIFQVSPQGTIEYPLLGSLRVENLTAVQISQLIRDKLKDGFIKEPYVMVFIKEFNSKKIHILGQVSKPGTFKYEDNMTIIEAITLAGGFTGSARPDSTVITRVEKGKESRFTLPVEKISKGLEKNFYLKPGDIIFVPETIL